MRKRTRKGRNNRRESREVSLIQSWAIPFRVNAIWVALSLSDILLLYSPRRPLWEQKSGRDVFFCRKKWGRKRDRKFRKVEKKGGKGVGETKEFRIPDILAIARFGCASAARRKESGTVILLGSIDSRRPGIQASYYLHLCWGLFCHPLLQQIIFLCSSWIWCM